MKSLSLGLFCVGAASAVVGSLLTTALAVALAPEVAANEDVEVVIPTPDTHAVDRARLATLLGLSATPVQAPPSPRTPFEYRLRGTLSGTFALFEPLSGGPARAISEGDTLGDGIVEQVGHRYVMVSRAGATEKILCAGAEKGTAAQAVAAAQMIEVSRAELETARTGFVDLIHQMRVIPAFEQGQAVGFKVAWMAPGAMALRVGLRQGDIVTAVNGHSLNSPDAVLSLFAELKSQTQFVADVRRGTESLRLGVKAL